MDRPSNRRIVLASRPVGAPRDTDFAIVDDAVPPVPERGLLLRTLLLSIDPYLRGRMNVGRSYAPPIDIGDAIVGNTVCEVVASTVDDFAAGDVVEAHTGWQTYAVSDGRDVRPLTAPASHRSAYLGVLGLPGLSAYVGVQHISRPQPGETVVVSSAAGTVGSVAGQLARARGSRVVGVAGGERKCAYLVDELGFDAAIDRQAPDFRVALRRACPSGVDVYFDNVGGDVFRAVFPLLNDFARVPVCGQIAHYNATDLPDGDDLTPLLLGAILVRRLLVQGFIVSDHLDLLPAFRATVTPLVHDGRIRYREEIVDGLEQAPRAFQRLFTGDHLGKLIVRVGTHQDCP